MRRFWNGLRWGSPDGPQLVIDWDARTIQIRDAPPRWAAWLLKRTEIRP